MPEFNMHDMFMRMAEQKSRKYHELNQIAVKGRVVLAGSSLMENFPVDEMLMSRKNPAVVYNRGMSALTIEDYDNYLESCIFELEPSKLFINIGSNDLNLPGDTVGNMITKYRALLNKIRERLPECKITLLAFYPVRPVEKDQDPGPGRILRTKELVNEANVQIEALAKELGLSFMNLNAPLTDAEGYMREEIATDQIHFSPAGYIPVLDQLQDLF